MIHSLLNKIPRYFLQNQKKSKGKKGKTSQRTLTRNFSSKAPVFGEIRSMIFLFSPQTHTFVEILQHLIER